MLLSIVVAAAAKKKKSKNAQHAGWTSEGEEEDASGINKKMHLRLRYFFFLSFSVSYGIVTCLKFAKKASLDTFFI